MERNVVKGAMLVGLGAASYGALATVVKMAYQKGFTTAEVSTSQFSVGLAGIILLNLIFKNVKAPGQERKVTLKNKFNLIIGGTSLGLTSIFYYFSVKYIPVSVAIVLLMQSVWMGLFLEAVLERKWPSAKKLIATVIVLFGTVLATNIFSNMEMLNWKGIVWGFGAGLTYTLSLYSSNSIATNLPPIKRSMWLLSGGLLIVVLIFCTSSYDDFNFSIFLPWGIFLAFFGTILPPLLFTSGMPHTGIGLGTIVASIELPVSVTFAYLLLNETVEWSQWAGIAFIITAVVMMNVNTNKAL